MSKIFDRLILGLQRLLKLEPGQTTAIDAGELVTNSIGMKLKLIPAGEFLMGAPDSGKVTEADEKPQHRVEITRPFYLGVYPVTQDEYEGVVGKNSSHFKGNGVLPVEQVSWFDSVKFCNRLSQREGLEPYCKIDGETVSVAGGTGYRLPTEAEWEYACRAGTTTKWSFGNDVSLLSQFAWFGFNPEDQTHPVGELKPNPWGLYDMHGNVDEWCWDWYSNEYYQQSRSADPSGPSSGGDRVLRGGAFSNQPWIIRSVHRLDLQPRYRYLSIGFRPARTYP